MNLYKICEQKLKYLYGDNRDNNQEVENQQEPSGGEDGHDQYHFLWVGN